MRSRKRVPPGHPESPKDDGSTIRSYFTTRWRRDGIQRNLRGILEHVGCRTDALQLPADKYHHSIRQTPSLLRIVRHHNASKISVPHNFRDKLFNICLGLRIESARRLIEKQ